jgi:hypothetical protein
MAAKPKTNKTISGHSADIRSSDWLGSVSPFQWLLDNPQPEYALDIKSKGRWYCLMYHTDESYLREVGKRQYGRYKKQRIRKIR